MQKHEKKTLKKRICVICRSVFFVQRYLLKERPCKFCSSLCQHKGNIKPSVFRKCETCGKRIKILRRNWTQTFCSQRCRYIKRRKEKRRCLFCKKKFLQYQSIRQRFCSKVCASSYLSGDKSPTWKGNAVRDYADRRSALYIRWRKAVLKRDNLTCRICGSKKSLHAHHVKGFADHPKLRFKVSNGLTACKPCHEKIHGHPVFG